MIKLRFLITAKKKALLILMIFISYSLKSQVTFTDSISLIPGTFKSVIPVGVLDMNNDGFDDIIHFRDRYTFVLSYYNKGNDFDTTNLGKMDSINVWSYPWSICVGDYDTDGDNDILFGGGLISLLLKNNSANGNFTTEVLPDTFFAQGSNFVDINNDGLLDIFICNDTAGNIIYKNSGEYFYKTNSLINTGDVAGNYASIWTDYDNDKDLDLYISKCYHDADSSGDLRRINVLYQNDGNGNFYESAKIAGINDSSQSWCADFGDIDNDGDFDIYLINHNDPHKLFENLGSGTFKDILSISNIATLEQDTFLYDFQCTFKDFDNDGFVDLLIAGERTYLYYNNGDNTFTLDSAFSTLMPDAPTFAIGDINNDGFLDIYMGMGNVSSESDRLYINNGNSNNYVAFLLQGISSNYNAIGARLFFYGNWGVQTREVRSGESYGVMHSFRQNFGLGQEQNVDSLVIWWPSGLKQIIKDIEPNSFHKIVEGYDISIPEKNNPYKSLTIYPNPVETEIHVIILSSKPPLTVNVLDITGKIIKSQNINQSNNISIDVRGLTTGTYLIRIEDHENSKYIGKFQIK